MNELKPRSGVRKRHRHALQLSTVSSVSLTPTDWTAIFQSLPQEPPKSFVDLAWNAYKKELWGKYKPDSLIGFELFRMAARSSEMPEGLRFVADFLALLCVVDGYGATVDGLREEEQRAVSLRAPVAPSLPVWPYSRS